MKKRGSQAFIILEKYDAAFLARLHRILQDADRRIPRCILCELAAADPQALQGCREFTEIPGAIAAGKEDCPHFKTILKAGLPIGKSTITLSLKEKPDPTKIVEK
jgi:hypothetical protein